MAVQLGPFELIEAISRGGMGVVWRARHRRQGATVAIKVLRPEARSRTLLEGLRNEVRAVAGMEHPHVVWLYDQGLVDQAAHEASGGSLQVGTPWLAMEYCPGGTLLHNAPRDWSGTRQRLLELLDALAHAHARGVIHRDLKPANVLFGGRRPGIKLSDFGMAYLVDRHLSGRARAPFGGGTAAWSSPEQIERRWADQGPWTDLYSLGVLGWWLVTGRRPFEGSAEAMAQGHLEGDLPALRPRFPVPSGVESWLTRLLDKQPTRRPRFAAEAARTLLDLPGVEGAGTPVMVEFDDTTTVTLMPFLQFASEPSSHSLSLVASPIPRDWRWGLVDPARPELVGAGLGLHGLREPPLVSREAERGRVWDALIETTRRRRPRIVVLRGPAGCGKTRLGSWLVRRVHELGIAERLVSGHRPQRDGLREGLSELIGRHAHCADRRRGEVLGRLTRVLSRIGIDDLDEVLALTELVQPASTRDQRPGGMGLRLDRDGRFAVARRYLERLCRLRPVVCFLDDVHWGLDSMLFAEAMLEKRLPLLFVMTAQDEALAERAAERHTLERLALHERVEILDMPPLEEHAGASLLRGLGLAPDLAVHLSVRSGGNPLFAVQLVGDWVERGVLVPGVEGLVAPDDATRALPDSIRSVWTARISRLCEGREGWRAPLEIAGLLGLDMALSEWEGACRAAGVSPPEGLWREMESRRLGRVEGDRRGFAHAMLRETVVAEAAPRAVGLHRACAEAIRGQDQPARLGRHLVAAARPEEAIAPLLEGAERRVLEGRYPAAERLLDEREEALDLLSAAEDAPERIQGWLLQARVSSLRGDLGGVGTWTEKALRVSEEGTGLRARALLSEASRRRGLGHLDRASKAVEEAHGIAATLGEPELLGLCLYERGVTLRRSGELEDAAAVLDEALAVCPTGQDWTARAHLNKALIAVQLDDPEAAGAALDHAEALAASEPFLIASVALARGDLLRDSGQRQFAEAHYRRAWATFERIGHHFATLARLNIGLLAVASDDIDEGRIHLRACLREARTRLPQLGAHLGLLVCSADLNHDGAWEMHLSALKSAKLAEADFARFFERAGNRAMRAGFTERAESAYTLAQQQWERLGLSEESKRLEAQLRPEA